MAGEGVRAAAGNGARRLLLGVTRPSLGRGRGDPLAAAQPGFLRPGLSGGNGEGRRGEQGSGLGHLFQGRPPAASPSQRRHGLEK